MARCNDCNKFVSYNTDVDPEVTNEQMTVHSDSVDYDVDIRIVNECAECGTEMKDAELNFSGSFDIDPKDHDDSDEWTMDVENVNRTERTEGKNRGTKTFYGAEADLVLRDSKGNELESVHINEYEQASGMNDLQ